MKYSITYRKVYSTYVARVRWTINGKRREKAIRLYTDDIQVVAERIDNIKNNIEFILNDIEYDWYWNPKNKGRTQLKHLTLKSIIDRWLKVRKSSIDIRESHYKRNIISMNRLIDVLGEDFKIRNIKNEHIERFKTFWSEKHSLSGIYINLRTIKTFLKWCKDREYISQVPKMIIKTLKHPPRYIREDWFDRVMKLNIDSHWKRAFVLYKTTGVRKMEVFDGYLDGSFLIVAPEKTKTKIERKVRLEPYQIKIVKEMQEKYRLHISNGFKAYNFTNRYNEIFVKCLKKIGVYKKGYSLHSLRHTYAIELYIKTNNIKLVQDKLGHENANTTDKYTKFKEETPEHFPILWGQYNGVSDSKAKIIPFEKELKFNRTSNP